MPRRKNKDLYSVIRTMLEDGGWFTRREACGESIERRTFYRLMHDLKEAGFNVEKKKATGKAVAYRLSIKC